MLIYTSTQNVSTMSPLLTKMSPLLIKKNGDIDFRFIVNNLKYFSRTYWINKLFTPPYDYLFDI